MQVRRKRGIATMIVVTVGSIGVVGAGAAHAAGVTLSVAPSTGLSNGSTVQVTVHDAAPSDLGRIYITECGNAYANDTALPATVNEDQDCQIIGWVLSPFDPTNIMVKEIGIGNGNRSCIAGGNRPCYVYGPDGINVNGLPTPDVPISFAQDPTGNDAQPSVTTTSLTAVGSPVATGKAQHTFVQVSDDVFRPSGTITVTENGSTVGTGPMTDGVADIVLSPGLSLGSHSLVAHYAGDGSFVGSDSPPTPMVVVGPNNVSIGDVSIVSGIGGTRTMNFPVVLSQAPTAAFTIPYSIVPGTAQPGVDYVAPKATAAVKFKAGRATVKYIAVKLLSDTHPTGTRAFTVHLATPVGGAFVLRDADGTGTIYDPSTSGATVNVGDVSIPEGDGGGPKVAKFSITLSAVPTHTTTVTVRLYTGLAQTATKGAKGKGDYNGVYTRTITFKAVAAPHVAPVTKYATAQIFPDSTNELDETFSVELTNVTSNPAQPFVLGRSLATGVILSDE